MLKKIKGTIDKIKEELDPRRAKFKKDVLDRGIFNIELFAQEKGLLTTEVENELNNLINEGQLRGYFTFNNTEFATYGYLKEHIKETIEGQFKLDLKKFSRDYGITLEVLYEILNELCSQNLQFGFFDIPENYTFFVLTKEEQDKFISKLKKEKIHITELAEFIDEFLESKEDIDITSLISDIQDTETENFDDWDLLAKDAIESTLGKKRAKVWIENLKSWNKIKGNFTEDQESFVPQDVVTKEIADYLNSSGRVKVIDLQKKLGLKEFKTLKVNLGILEKNGVIKGFLVSNNEEYATENRLFDEIEEIIKIKQQDIIDISTIQAEIGLDQRNTAALIRKLIKMKRISGLVSADSSRFFTYELLNKIIMNFIENHDKIKIKDINKDFKLLYKDLTDYIEDLISKNNLRILFSWDKSELVKEEKALFELMDILKKSKKSLLVEVGKALKLEVKQIIRLIKYMLEFGLINGKLTNKEFILQ
ncbi:MAG: hypothetical protein ACTSRG_21060 [Candidatus Helarchaeota archaeon]